MGIGDHVYLESMECSYFSGDVIYKGEEHGKLKFCYVGSGITLMVPKSMINKDVLIKDYRGR